MPLSKKQKFLQQPVYVYKKNETVPLYTGIVGVLSGELKESGFCDALISYALNTLKESGFYQTQFRNYVLL